MDINREELRQITLFKDSVLSAADARRMEIISQAQKAGDEAIKDARAMCRLSNHAAVEQRLALNIERRTSAATQAARLRMLAARQKLVDDMFGQVEQQLLAFARGDAYGGWLAKKLAGHAFKDGGAVTVYLRGADMEKAEALKKVLPGCTVQADPAIRLGGLKATDGRVLFDDTLDLALRAEKESFYQTSGLNL